LNENEFLKLRHIDHAVG